MGTQPTSTTASVSTQPTAASMPVPTVTTTTAAGIINQYSEAPLMSSAFTPPTPIPVYTPPVSVGEELLCILVCKNVA